MGGTLRVIAGACAVGLAILAGGRPAGGENKVVVPATQEGGEKDVLQIRLPKQVQPIGTPKNLPPGVNLNKDELGRKRPPFQAPRGATVVSKGKPVTSSDAAPIVGDLPQVTDGDKEAAEGNFVELAFDKQWVQIDLEDPCKIAAIVVWHRHSDIRIYRDVIVQVSNDPDFIKDVVTLFNNDNDNSSGLGVGKDFEYIDNYEGKLVDGKGAMARYVRIWSKGNTVDDQNHYTEVEVYGLPAK